MRAADFEKIRHEKASGLFALHLLCYIDVGFHQWSKQDSESLL